MTINKWLQGVLAVLLLCALAPAHAAPEYRIKAAILYNLTRMVEWPNESLQSVGTAMKICFIGEDPFADALDLIRSKQVRNRSLEFITGVTLETIAQCEMLFISSSEAPRLKEIIQAAYALPLLTVSDTEGFAEQGVVVNLMREEKKIRMELNKTAAERAKLIISPTLEKLAVFVENSFEPEETSSSAASPE